MSSADDARDVAADERLASRLDSAPPLPAASFRRDLAERVDRAAIRSRIRDRPDHLWPIAGGFALVGAALLLAATAGI